MSSWVYDRFEAVGRGHLVKNIPCQDKTFIKEENNVLALALSDGCGSSKWSHFGAEITTITICDILTNEFDFIYQNDNGVEIKAYLLNKVVLALEKFAAENKYNLNDLDATLTFAAKKGNLFITGRLGDGIIGIVRDGRLSIASMETKNEEINSTYYPSMIRRSNPNNIYNEFDLKKSNKTIDGFVLMSDGSSDSLIDRRVPFQFSFANAIKSMFYLVRDVHKENLHEDIQSFLEKSIITRTSDDCSLVFACDETLEILQTDILYTVKPAESPIEQNNIDEAAIEEELSDPRTIDILKSNSLEFVTKCLTDEGLSSKHCQMVFSCIKSKKAIDLQSLISNTGIEKNNIRIILTNFVEFNLIEYKNQKFKVLHK